MRLSTLKMNYHHFNRKMLKKGLLVCLTAFFTAVSGFAQATGPDRAFLPPEKMPEMTIPQVKFNSWELIVYRPQNEQRINTIRCWLKLEDENGNDVTYSAAKATYEWVSISDVVNKYQKTYWLEGGVAMHLNLKSGKYKISVYTPVDRMWPYKSEIPWTSNVLEYDTENPTKVIFVSPTRNDNGFYNGGWKIWWAQPKNINYDPPFNFF